MKPQQQPTAAAMRAATCLTRVFNLSTNSLEWVAPREIERQAHIIDCETGLPEAIEALRRIVDGKDDDPKDSNGLSAGEISVGDLRAARNALAKLETPQSTAKAKERFLIPKPL